MTHVPPAAPDHVARESGFAIQTVKGRLRVRDDRLDLDDEQGAEQWMEGEDVDRPALAPDRERDLDLNNPTKAPKESHEGIDQGRMRLVHQSVEALASPSKVEVDVRAKSSRRLDERAHRDTIELAPIDRSDQGTREAGTDGHVPLAALESDPQRAELASESEGIHPPIVGRLDALGLT